jgi:hypothetical protein
MYKTTLSKNNSKSKLNSTLRSTSRNKLWKFINKNYKVICLIIISLF